MDEKKHMTEFVRSHANPVHGADLAPPPPLEETPQYL
jgi:hypothetical protein